MISGQDGTEDSESDDDEIPNHQPYGLPLDMLANESFSEISSYDNTLRIDVLDNGALLKMVEGWQTVVRQMGSDYAVAHPHSQAVLEELGLSTMTR